MTTTINASTSNGLVQTADGSGVLKVQSNGVTTNALAWVNFNGTTSPGTIRSQYNVSSVTKNSTGNYTLNFTTALIDVNYAAVISANYVTSGAGVGSLGEFYNGTRTTSALQIAMQTYNSAAYTDASIISVAIFGN